MRENNSEELASTSASSDTSVENFPAPLPFVKSHIAYHVDGDIIPTVDSQSILANATHFDIRDSTEVFIGNKTIIQGDVTVYHGPLSEHQNTEGQINENKSKTECNGNDRVNASTSAQTQTNKFRYPLIITIFILFLVVSVAVVLTFIKSVPVFLPVNPNTTNYIKGHPVYSRANWGALAPKEGIPQLSTPISVVIISHTSSDGCSNFFKCANQSQHLQHQYFEKGHRDVGYNFLIGGEGGIYEGRGWDYQNSIRTKSIDISFIGCFIKEMLTSEAEDAAKALIEEGVKTGKLDEQYKLIGENQTSPLRYYSPGGNIVKVIKTWDHYYSGTML